MAKQMKLSEIKDAVNAGKTVHWKQKNYVVIKDRIEQWLIKCTNNDSCIGLTWRDGTTMNGDEADFYVEEKQ